MFHTLSLLPHVPVSPSLLHLWIYVMRASSRLRGKYRADEGGRRRRRRRRGYVASRIRLLAHGSNTGASKIMQGAWPQSIRCGNLPPCPCPPELPVATPLVAGRARRRDRRPTSRTPQAGILDFLDHLCLWVETFWVAGSLTPPRMRPASHHPSLLPQRQLNASHGNGYRLYLRPRRPGINRFRDAFNALLPSLLFYLGSWKRQILGRGDWSKGDNYNGRNSINKEKYRISIFKRWITIRPNEIPFLRAWYVVEGPLFS